MSITHSLIHFYFLNTVSDKLFFHFNKSDWHSHFPTFLQLMSLFVVGTSIEYKYKDKDWKNGEIISSNKQEISIKILKKINKYKTLQIPRSKAMTLLYVIKRH